MKSLFWTDQSSHLKSLESPQPFKLEPGSSFTYLSDLKAYILFGGLKSQGQKKETAPPAKKNPFASKSSTASQQKVFQIQQVFLYYPSQKLWKIQTCTGKFPLQRIYHYTSYNSPHLLVYGGIDKKLYSDIYMLNSQTWVWKKLVVLDSHIPRLHGCMISHISNKSNKRFIMGGVSGVDKTDVLGDVWMLSLEGVIDSNNNELPGAFWSKIDNQTIQNEMVPVRNFTANVIEEDKAFIFGGFTSSSLATDNTYTFDLINYKMQRVETKGERPTPRGEHLACLIKPGYLVVLGGKPEIHSKTVDTDIYLYHISINTWEKVIPGGNTPLSLNNFCMSSSLSSTKGEIIILTSIQSTVSQFALEQLSNNEQYKISLDKSVISEKQNDNSLGQQPQDINQMYSLSQSQKKKIQDLQSKLRQTKQKNSFIKTKIQKLKTQPLTTPSSSRITHNRTQFSTQLLNLLLLEHKKRKFLELKSMMLQNTIKDTEKLVVNLNEFSQPEARAKHIRTMKEYRLEMEEILGREKVLKGEINGINADIGIDLQRMFVESLSSEESKLLALLK